MKTLRVHILTTLMLLISGLCLAQQTPQWTQYMLNKYGVNPAFGGMEQSLSITTGIRSQWNQLPGSPKTQMINAHIPMYFLKGSVGMNVVNDETGPLRRTEVGVSYNYVQDATWGLISVGLRVGAQQVTLNGQELRTPDGIYVDQTVDHQDPRLLGVSHNGISPLWTLGAYYIKDLLEVGLSLENFPSNKKEAGKTTYNSKTAITLFASYQYPLTEIVSIEPNILLKTDGVETQLDIGVLGYYNQLFGGLSLRGYSSNTLDAFSIIAGTKLSKHIKISYSFDMGLSGLRSHHDGTHEFIINYNLHRPIRTGELPKIIYNPRFR